MLHLVDLNRLRCFHAVAAHCSVTRAAKELHLSPSAVSQQLSKLEAELGHALLERHGRGIRLTEAAEVLAPHASEVLSRLERAHADIEALSGAIAGEIHLGAFPTSARGLVPTALAQLQSEYPRLTVRLQECEPRDAMAALIGGDLDAIIVQDWFNSPLVVPEQLSRRPLLDDEADLVVREDHRLARRRSVQLSEIVDERWISWEAGSVCNDWLVLTLRLSGIEPNIVHNAAEHPTQLALVSAGLGVAVIPRLGRGPMPAGLCAIPVRPALTRHVYALWRTDAARRATVLALIDALEAAAKPPKRRGAGR
ncbi:MAG: LysR family transcriptional regulator [Verrucomicrobia bacterium]|nr:LysR family transcriptional regulator [Verrucomicrobiota bacterium]